jgi:hypothetical protein
MEVGRLSLEHGKAARRLSANASDSRGRKLPDACQVRLVVWVCFWVSIAL